MREGGGETTVAKLQKLLEIEIRPPSFEECYYDSTMPKAATCMEFLWYCILPARLRAEQGEAISLGEGEKKIATYHERHLYGRKYRTIRDPQAARRFAAVEECCKYLRWLTKQF